MGRKRGPHTETLNVRVSPEVHQQLEEIGAVLGLDVSSLVRMVLSEKLPEYQARADQVRQARERPP